MLGFPYENARFWDARALRCLETAWKETGSHEARSAALAPSVAAAQQAIYGSCLILMRFNDVSHPPPHVLTLTLLPHRHTDPTKPSCLTDPHAHTDPIHCRGPLGLEPEMACCAAMGRAPRNVSGEVVQTGSTGRGFCFCTFISCQRAHNKGLSFSLEVPFPRERPNQTGGCRAQPGRASAVTRVPCFSGSGEAEEWSELLWEPAPGKLHHQALCFRWHHKGRKEWLLFSTLSILSALAGAVGLSGPVPADIGNASSSQPPTSVWPEATRQFSG